MPSIEAAIEARAVAHGIGGLLGSNPMRFYPTLAEQGTSLPHVNYTVVSDPPVHVMGADRDSQARTQFDVWASSWAIARQVRDQLLAAFDRWSGLSGGTTVQASVCESRGFTVEPDEPGLTPRITLEFTMTYSL